MRRRRRQPPAARLAAVARGAVCIETDRGERDLAYAEGSEGEAQVAAATPAACLASAARVAAGVDAARGEYGQCARRPCRSPATPHSLASPTVLKRPAEQVAAVRVGRLPHGGTAGAKLVICKLVICRWPSLSLAMGAATLVACSWPASATVLAPML